MSHRTLLSMSRAERKAHEQRLTMLRNASDLQADTKAGFVFSVDLNKMASSDLDLWIANEQGCCSFLKVAEARQRMIRKP